MTGPPARPGGDGFVPLPQATDTQTFGGKAAQLAAAAGRGLPVPPGLALAWPLVAAVAEGDAAAAAMVAHRCSELGGAVAVRSSALGEDSMGASFAGQHASVLNVDPGDVAEAVGAVWRSAHADAAVAYRRRLGLSGSVRVAVVVQRLVDADAAGVLFDRNPLTGADEVVIEAAWGLGEAVVAGLVTPDHFRLDEKGRVVDRRAGNKAVAVRPAVGGGTRSEPVGDDRARSLCLDDGEVARLYRLAMTCAGHFGRGQDLEWALAGGDVWLVQRRPITST